MFFPVTNYFEVQLNNASTVYTATQDCFVWAAPVVDDFDGGSFVQISYAARPPYTPANVVTLSGSNQSPPDGYNGRIQFLQSGDRVILATSGPTACKIRVMTLMPRPA